jgi:hypothetical protein
MLYFDINISKLKLFFFSVRIFTQIINYQLLTGVT